MNCTTLDEARAAKAKLVLLLRELPELSGVGISRIGGGFGLKVNLEAPTSFPIPSEVDGVPVIVAVVGPIVPL